MAGRRQGLSGPGSLGYECGYEGEEGGGIVVGDFAGLYLVGPRVVASRDGGGECGGGEACEEEPGEGGGLHGCWCGWVELEVVCRWDCYCLVGFEDGEGDWRGERKKERGRWAGRVSIPSSAHDNIATKQ